MITYTLAPLSLLQIATMLSLLAAVFGLWIGPRSWWTALAVATVLGYIAGLLQGLAFAWIALAILLCFLYVRVRSLEFAGTASGRIESRILGTLTALGVIVMSLLLGLHALSGFNNPLAIENLRLTPDAEPYTLYLNFDKTLAGVLLLGVCYPNWRGVTGLRSTLRLGLWMLVASNVVVLIAASYLLNFVRFDAKWTSFFWLWAVTNLFSTCLSEEAFFRGFVQRELQTHLSRYRYGQALALLVSAALFGLAHFAGGWRYVLLSMFAGLGYGWVYRRTQRIEWAMFAHFALNATHFLLFTYPRLA